MGETRTDIRVGDCVDVLRTLDAGSVQCCVTSPPYFGLRDYGHAGQIGLEATPDAYVAKLVEVFREVRRVLRDDGTLWLNLGDSYAREPAKGGSGTPNGRNTAEMRYAGGQRASLGARVRVRADVSDDDRRLILRELRVSLANRNAEVVPVVGFGDDFLGLAGGVGENLVLDDLGNDVTVLAHVAFPVAVIPVNLRRYFAPAGAKPKDLLGIPWRVAFALQADGWYLRSDIIWHKPNPMPESVTDRPTKAHEYLFLLAKSERYYYDSAAIAEDSIYSGRVIKAVPADAKTVDMDPNGVQRTQAVLHQRTKTVGDTRNRRTVWTVTTQPFSGAHFATFPPKLIEPCILAGSRKGDTVLDPFGGAGTTGLVADRLSRNALLIELNPAYAALARQRITDDAPLFADGAA